MLMHSIFEVITIYITCPVDGNAQYMALTFGILNIVITNK
jgi:hypothetical protein